MYKSYLPKDEPGKIPFGQAHIECTQGYWMFNNKRVTKCPAPVQLLVAFHIRTLSFALPTQEVMPDRKPAISLELRGKHLVLFRHKHIERRQTPDLKKHNYVFPATDFSKELGVSVPANSLSYNTPRQLSSYPNIEQIEFVKKEAV